MKRENPCQLCAYFERDGTMLSPWGECHRHPPTLVQDPQAEDWNARFPPVRADDWCGDFESEEEDADR